MFYLSIRSLYIVYRPNPQSEVMITPLVFFTRPSENSFTGLLFRFVFFCVTGYVVHVRK